MGFRYVEVPGCSSVSCDQQLVYHWLHGLQRTSSLVLAVHVTPCPVEHYYCISMSCDMINICSLIGSRDRSRISHWLLLVRVTLALSLTPTAVYHVTNSWSLIGCIGFPHWLVAVHVTPRPVEHYYCRSVYHVINGWSLIG